MFSNKVRIINGRVVDANVYDSLMNKKTKDEKLTKEQVKSLFVNIDDKYAELLSNTCTSEEMCIVKGKEVGLTPKESLNQDSETEQQIEQLKQNMDKARARGYDTAPYQKEIDRLKSMDALSEIDKKMLSQGKYLKVILPSGMGEDLYTNNFTAAKEMAKEYGVGTRVVNLNENKDKYTGDPLTDKGKEIMASLKEEYGEEKGEQVFYAMKNSGQIEGIDSKTTKDTEVKTITVSGPGIEGEDVEVAVDVSPRWGTIYRIWRIPNVPDRYIDKNTGYNSLEKLKLEALRIMRSVGY